MTSLLAAPVCGLAATFTNADASDAVRSSSSSARLASLRSTGLNPLRHVRASTYRRRAPAATRRVSAAAEESASEASSATEEKPSVTSPFAGKKISALLAARAAAASKASNSSAEAPPAPKTPAAESASAFPPPPSPFPSSFSKSLPTSPPASPFASPAAAAPASSPAPPSAAPTPAPAGRSSVNAVVGGSVKPTVSFRGKAIVDAFKQGPVGTGAKSGSGGVGATRAAASPLDGSIRPGSPLAPANIFQEKPRTPEEIEAEKWRFQVSRDQFLLVLSFFASSLIMLGTVYVVWKLGAIHFNEV